MRFTVFTPTYNRAHTLPRLYESIRRQTVRDFEWVIVDDGSTDGTAALIQNWRLEDNDFPIRYFWQPNQHKKVAFNRGVREACAPWFVPIDSDDELLPDALEQFARMWATIPLEKHPLYSAVYGLCIDNEGRVVGDHFPDDPLDTDAVTLYFDYHVRGDKFPCFRVAALKEFPFPEDIPGLVPEGVVWFRMANVYKLRCFNVPLLVNHHDTVSLTRPADPLAARRRCAQGAVLYYAEAIDCLTLRRLIRSPLRAVFLAVQHGRFAAYLPPGVRPAMSKKWVWRAWAALFRPAGWVLYGLDRWNLPARFRDVLARLGLRFY